MWLIYQKLMVVYEIQKSSLPPAGQYIARMYSPRKPLGSHDAIASKRSMRYQGRRKQEGNGSVSRRWGRRSSWHNWSRMDVRRPAGGEILLNRGTSDSALDLGFRLPQKLPALLAALDDNLLEPAPSVLGLP